MQIIINADVVAWAKPQISSILGYPVQDSEVESVLAMESDEVICRHLASFSENPAAYIHATDFVKELRARFVDAATTPQFARARQKKPPMRASVRVATTPQNLRDEADMNQMFDESMLEGLTISAPKTMVGRVVDRRNICGCLGLDHEVSRNCIACGRIMCVKEADVACVFCGFGADPKVAKAIFKEYKEGEGYDAAVAMVQKLLSYDKDSASRTRVFDTETDFYEERYNPWCTESERQVSAAHAERQEAVYNDPALLQTTYAKLELDLEKMKLTMSDAQKEFVDRQNEALKKYLADERRRVDEVGSANTRKLGAAADASSDEDDWLLQDPERRLTSTTGALRPQLNQDSLGAAARRVACATDDLPPADEPAGLPADSFQLDEEFSEPAFASGEDRGVCLTLHQPWASLIVWGLKRIEGRIWNTDYRGRLWIHAAAQEPEPERIRQMEAYYSTVYPNAQHRPPFPASYPTRCLLGCVDLIDVARDHCGLWDKYPWVVEVNDSPFKFILKNPQRLLAPIPMPGEHKLWHVHKPSVYHRALMRDKFAKVTPAHIDVNDPLSLEPALLEQARAAARVDGQQEASLALQVAYSKFREHLLVDAPRLVFETVAAATRKPLRASAKVSILKAVFDAKKSLPIICGALALSFEHAFDSQAVSYLGLTDEASLAEHLRDVRAREVFASARIHPAARRAAQSILEQVDNLQTYTIGGPHTPPADVLELWLAPPNENEDPADMLIVGEPTVVLGVSGDHVLMHEGISIFVSAGDAVVCHSKEVVLRVARRRLEEATLDACALAIFRYNITL